MYRKPNDGRKTIIFNLNEIIDNIKVLKFHSKSRKGNVWLCKFLKCGHKHLLAASEIVRHYGTKICPICGILISSRRRYVGDISGVNWNHIRHGAKSRKIDFNITQEQGWNLFLKQHRKCALTGLDIYFTDGYRVKLSKQTASLDRIDSYKPYTINNIQWVHKDINKMKNVFTQEKFKKLCSLVTNFGIH